MSKKLTKEEFVQKAKEKHGDKYDYSLVNYINCNDKIIIICKKQDHNNFFQTPHDHLMGRGCKVCAGHIKLTNDDIDNYLIDNNRNIKREDEYNGLLVKISWKCLKCVHTWKATPGNIKSGCGCPKCAGKTLLTNDDIDKYLIDNNIQIKRRGSYINSNAKTRWECLNKCGHIWEAAFIYIKHSNAGCPKCARNIKFTNDDIDNYLIDNNRQIKREGEYKNSRSKIKWKCLNDNCDNIWESSFENIKYNNTGCPVCAPPSKNEKLTREYLKELNINVQPFKVKLSHNINYTTPDFWIPNYNLFIEINGQQHYKPTKFNSDTTDEQAEEKFKKQQIRDQNLRDYCNQNNIYLEEVVSTKYKNQEKLEKYLKDILNKYKKENYEF